MPVYSNREPETRFFLPFSTLAPNRFEDFTKNMEMGAILYLAESGREKGQSHILRKPSEKIVFIAELYYPLWLVPFERTALLFDGFGITSHKLVHFALPDIQVFNEDMKEGHDTTEIYMSTLARNADYFRKFKCREERILEGLIVAPDLIDCFRTYLHQAEQHERSFSAEVTLAPTIDYCEVQNSVDQLSTLRRRTEKDIADLDLSISLLDETTTHRIQAIRKSIGEMRKKHNKRIEKTKHKIAKEIAGIQNIHNRRMTRTSRRYRDRFRRLHKNRVRLEKTLRRLRTRKKWFEAKVQSSKRRKRKRSEKLWSLRLKRIEKELPNVEREIKRIFKEIEATEALKTRELMQMKIDYDVHVETAEKPLLVLRAGKETELSMKQHEITKLEEMTSQITKQMLSLIDARKADLMRLDRLSMPTRKDCPTLVRLPFYLVRYERENEKRYVAYPPSLACSLGTLAKVKGNLGTSKMKFLLRPRSRALTSFLNKFLSHIAKYPILEKEIAEASVRKSILFSKQLRIGVEKGLKELERENWMSKSDLQTFSELLYLYA